VQIDETSPEHPYLQLAGLLRADIESGKITSQLPSITQLTEETVPGRGTFVVERRPGRSGGADDRHAPARPHGHVPH